MKKLIVTIIISIALYVSASAQNIMRVINTSFATEMYGTDYEIYIDEEASKLYLSVLSEILDGNLYTPYKTHLVRTSVGDVLVLNTSDAHSLSIVCSGIIFVLPKDGRKGYLALASDVFENSYFSNLKLMKKISRKVRKDKYELW